MDTEKATTEYDLPHEFEAAGLRDNCRCARVLKHHLHRMQKVETASERLAIVTEKGV